MKKSVEIQGLPIFSLVDGTEIGHVKQLIVNPEEGRIELFLVEHEQDAIGVHILPYTSVIGVGDFAVTVETSNAIQELANVTGARDLMLRGYKVIGTRVLSRKGQLLGSVNEYYVDEENGTITACSFEAAEDASSIKLFDRPNIMTFGRDVIVIKQEELIFSSFTDRSETAADTTTESEAPVTQATTETAQAQAEVAATTAQVVAVGPYAYLVGKVLREDLRDDAGELLAAQGTALTAELIEHVKTLSPTLFMKLNRIAQ